MLLGRLANHLGPDTVAKRCLPIRTNWIAKFFVAMDVVTFCIQGGGGGLQTSDDPDQANLGHKVRTSHKTFLACVVVKVD